MEGLGFENNEDREAAFAGDGFLSGSGSEPDDTDSVSDDGGREYLRSKDMEGGPESRSPWSRWYFVGQEKSHRSNRRWGERRPLPEKERVECVNERTGRRNEDGRRRPARKTAVEVG